MIYHYNKVSGEYTGKTAKEFDPVAGNPLIPAYATDIVPPGSVAGFAVCFDTASNSWVQKEDARGAVYDIASGDVQQWDKLGALPATLTALPPATPFDVFKGGAWVTDITAMRLAYESEVDGVAEGARAVYLPSVGQALTYQEKERQARAYQAAGFTGVVPALVSFDVSAGLAVDAKAAALAIIQASDGARLKLTSIEGARRKAIASIRSAVDVKAVDAAKAAGLAALAQV